MGFKLNKINKTALSWFGKMGPSLRDTISLVQMKKSVICCSCAEWVQYPYESFAFKWIFEKPFSLNYVFYEEFLEKFRLNGLSNGIKN